MQRAFPGGVPPPPGKALITHRGQAFSAGITRAATRRGRLHPGGRARFFPT
jgi:hypothetical protein